MPLDAKVLEVLVCPKCKGGLEYRENEAALDCAACALRFRVEDSIPVMIIEEATPLDK